MDKLDESIKQAKQTMEPKADFVQTTMQQITASQPKRSWGIKMWAPALAGGLVVIALVFLLLPSGGKDNAKNTGQSTSALTSQAATALPAGTSNAALSSDLNTIDNQINQENADQKDANASINDNSQVISVPTD